MRNFPLSACFFTVHRLLAAGLRVICWESLPEFRAVPQLLSPSAIVFVSAPKSDVEVIVVDIRISNQSGTMPRKAVNQLMSRSASSLVRALAFLSVVVAGVTVSARPQASHTHPMKLRNPVKANPDSIAAGQQTFQKYCGFCHGADAKGNGPMAPKGTHPPDLTDDTWLYGSSDAEIFTNAREGIGPKFEMKPYKDKIAEQDIWNIVNYLRSISSKGAALDIP